MAAPRWNVLFFEDWVEREGLDLIRGTIVKNVYTQPLKPWKRTGGSGVMIQLDGTGDLDAAYICEIPLGGELNPEKHFYEDLIFVLKGRTTLSGRKVACSRSRSMPGISILMARGTSPRGS